MEIFPSLISADLLHLGSVIESLEKHCDGFHVDIMDNYFVPNLTWGAQFANAIARATTKPVFVHLMIDRPQDFVERLQLKEGDTIAFHIESFSDVHLIEKVAGLLKKNDWKVSLAISPGTPLKKLYSFGQKVDSMLLMSVNPGFSGQAFLPESFARLDELVVYRISEKLEFLIVMDGGIKAENIGELAKRGCDAVAVAAAIFENQNPIKMLQALYDRVEQT